MMCRGWPIPRNVLSVWPKKSTSNLLLSAPSKNFSCFHIWSPYTMFRLTTDISFDLPTYDPFKSDTKSEHKSDVSDINLTTELSNTIFLKCTLRCCNISSTNHQPILNPIIDPSCYKWALYPPTPHVKNYSIGHKSEKKGASELHIYHFLWSI